jgi:threonine/homoserine/homoserine lactone efflux protein
MSPNQAEAFFLFALVTAVTPGPSNTLILATGSTVGAHRGLPCVLGAAVGMSALLFCSTLGLGQLIIAQPTLLKVLNGCGVAFLLWMAWRIANADGPADVSATKPAGFFEAAAFQWVNPKGWLVAVSAAATYLQATPDSALFQALTFAALFFAAAFPSGLVWLSLGAALQTLLRNNRARRAFNIAMGIVMAASIVMLLR